MKNASAVVSYAELSKSRKTNNFLKVQKKWSALSFDHVRPTCYVLKRILLMKLHFLSLAASTRKTIYTAVSHASVYLFIAFQSVESRTTCSRKPEVAHCDIPIPLSDVAISSETRPRHAAYFFCCPAIADRLQIMDFFGIELLSSLALDTLFALYFVLCCFLRRICMFCPRFISSLELDGLFFCSFFIEQHRIRTRQALPRASRCKRHIPTPILFARSAGDSSVTSPNLDQSDASRLAFLTEKARSRSKFYTWLGAPTCCTTMILLAFSSVTNAQSCSQVLLGLERSSLASTALPSGLMFFAGGWTGLFASSV
jgi:hypothetical protein